MKTKDINKDLARLLSRNTVEVLRFGVPMIKIIEPVESHHTMTLSEFKRANKLTLGKRVRRVGTIAVKHYSEIVFSITAPDK